MQDRITYRQGELVLNVSNQYDPMKLDLDEWSRYFDVLCGDREYQKEAIRAAIIFMASGRYQNTEDLIKENYERNLEIQKKYHLISDYLSSLQIRHKLFANIDLATGAGKSYIIYGIAQIMLALGVVKRVLVLCPSLTIEQGLTEKFLSLASSSDLRDAIPDSAAIRSPSIKDANSTIKEGDICVENIHAIYDHTGSSIKDSFENGGEDTMILNDESHHIFNHLYGIAANSAEGKNIKKWKGFLTDSAYNFKYIMGFTGTAYIEDEYFNDVIYRYSLRQAIDDKVVKSIDYVQKDDSSNVNEKFQKILQNHEGNKLKYNRIKPLTIMVTKDIKSAERLRENLIDFLVEEGLSRGEAEEKVLIVTSSDKHKSNVLRLKQVDSKEDSVEWIISVSMLTEGWDVKNVFQIVPWEDRAFNSKLLISQVMGRGLRLPPEYETPQPSLVIFNHDNWSKYIKSLVDEILEIETRVISSVKFDGDRNQYHFTLHNLDYEKQEREIEHSGRESQRLNYSNMREEGIQLSSQIEQTDKYTNYEDLSTGNTYSQRYDIKHRLKSVDEIVHKIVQEFKMRDWEGELLGLDESEVYSKDNLPPARKIRELVEYSMRKVGITGDYLIEANAQKVFQSFSTLFRQKGKTVINEIVKAEPIIVNTADIRDESAALSNFRKESTFFYTEKYEDEVRDQKQLVIVEEFLEDESFRRGADRQISSFLFKTPQNFVFTNGDPEHRFVIELCKKGNAQNIEAWIKSRGVGFYSIEYSFREGSHTKQKGFNPDFFIKCVRENWTYFLVVEIKDDRDDSAENKAKYKYGKAHFQRLNEKLEEIGIHERYIFHFLSPSAYGTFFQYLNDGKLFLKDVSFRCDLENLLE